MSRFVIVCSCNVINHRQIEEAARELASDPDRRLVTPGAVFKRLGVRPRCGGCFQHVAALTYKAQAEIAGAEARRFPAEDRDWNPTEPRTCPAQVQPAVQEVTE